MTEGVRFPTMAFITGGAGQADDGIPPQPFETFCYDSALLEARIENFNVVPYTSVLPKEMYGNIVPINDDIVKQFKHGAVLEVIMAGHGASRDQHKAIATGLGVCWGKDKTANSSAAGLPNMLNFSTPRLMTTLPEAMPKCG